MNTIVIDPGHGGADVVGGSSPNNAVGPNGTLEKDLTLDIARRMQAASQEPILLTRDSDINLGLADRARVARDARAVVFVSIHLNGYDGHAQGTETWVHNKAGGKSASLAKAVQRTTLAATGLVDRGVKRNSFGVLSPKHHHGATACCLVEVSFMDVAAEEARLADEHYRQQIADALLAGIRMYLSTAAVALEAVEAEMPEPEDGFEVLVR